MYVDCMDSTEIDNAAKDTARARQKTAFDQGKDISNKDRAQISQLYICRTKRSEMEQVSTWFFLPKKVIYLNRCVWTTINVELNRRCKQMGRQNQMLPT